MATFEPDRNYLLRNSAIVTGCRGLGVASGFALDAFILSRLGLSLETDAFFAAFALPQIITAILELQTATVLVPVFVQTNHQAGAAAFHRLVNGLLSGGGLLLAALGAAGALGARGLIALQAPGLPPSGLALAASLAAILCWLPLLSGVAAILRAALNGLHRFAVAASCKLIGNLVALGVVVAAYGRLGIHALGYGFLLGGVAQVAVLLVALGREGYRLRPVLSTREPRVAEVGRLLVYTLLGQSLSEGRQLIENFLASFFPAGSLSALRYASRIVAAVSGVMVGGIATATLPLVSRSAARHDLSELRRVLQQAVRLLALVALPMSAWMALAGRPFLAVLFERGRFTSADTAATSTLLVLMVPVIFLSRLVSLAQIPFYARQDMLTPLWNILLTVAAYLGLVAALYGPLGIYSLPVANSLALAVAAVGMLWSLQRSIGPLGVRELAPFFARLSGGLGMMTAAMLAGRAAMRPASAALPGLAVASLLGALAFLATLGLLGVVDIGRLRPLGPAANQPRR